MTFIRFIIAVVATAALGALFAVAGAFIGGRIIGSGAGGLESLGLVVLGLLVGYPFGIIVGLVLLKRLLRESGSLLMGILGAIIGTIAILALAEPLNLNSNVNLLVATFALIVPVLSLGGFCLKRK